MTTKEILKYAIGITVAVIGLLIMIVDKIAPSYSDDDRRERTFTQASMWLIGGLIIIFS